MQRFRSHLGMQTLMLIKSSSQREFTLEMANQIRNESKSGQGRKYALWNEIVRRHRQTIQELADLKLSPDAAGRRLPKCVQDIVYWYLSNATIELTYGELVHPHYFVPMSQWLHKGHLPITWEGNFPQGKPVIF